MPLITKLFPKLERSQEEHSDANQEEEESYDNYSDFEEGVEDDDDMDGNSILHRPRPKKLVPDLPQKSQLRASRILENLTIQLHSLEQAAISDMSKPDTDPLEHYLSSEEEASESADEYDESILELDSDRPSSSCSSNYCHEDVARVVSFMFVGKPTMISIPIFKPTPKQHLQRSSRRPSLLKLTPSASMTSLRRPSTPRSSSLGAPTNTLTITTAASTNPNNGADKTKNGISTFASKASFLSYDPFPAAEAQELSVATANTKDVQQPDTPHPTAKEGSGWTGSLNRRFSLTSKTMRKSSLSNMSKLNTAYAPSAANLPTSNLSATPVTSTEQETPTSPVGRGSGEGGNNGVVRYEDIMRGAIRVPPSPKSPQSPKSPLKFRSGLSGLVSGGRMRTRVLKA